MKTEKSFNQKGGMQLPKKNSESMMSKMYGFKNVHTGTNATNPAILKAQANKKKSDSILSNYAKKAATEKAAGIAKAKKKP